MITLENVVFKTELKIFQFHGKIMNSWWVLVLELLILVWVFLLRRRWFGHETPPAKRHSHEQYIPERFWVIWRTGS